MSELRHFVNRKSYHLEPNMTASRFAVIKEQVFATAKMFQDCEPVIRRRLLNDALYKQAKQLSDDLFELILEITEEEVNNV